MSTASLAVGEEKPINSLDLLCMDRVVGWWSKLWRRLHPVGGIKLQEVQQIRNFYLLSMARNSEQL